MFSRLLTTTCALAAVANAALVMPQLMASEKHPGPARVGQAKATIELPCPSCPLALGNVDGHPARWAEGSDTQLLIDLTSDGQQLYFNGAPIYPISPANLGHALAAKQIYADGVDDIKEELFNRPIPLSTGVEISPTVETVRFHLDAANPSDIVEKVPMRRMTIEVLGLGANMVKVDTIRVAFSDDKLQIHDVALEPYSRHATAESDACATVLCRVRTSIKNKLAHLTALLRQKVHAIKHACMRRPVAGHLVRPHGPIVKGGPPKFQKVGQDAVQAQHRRPHPHRHHHHHKHHGLHRLLHHVIGFISHIIVPVLIGIAAGMIVSGIGMLIGQLIIFVASRLFGRRDHVEYVLVLEDDAEETEETEFLPKYEDVYTAPPPFEEKAAQ